jgi:hypothetical protein
MLAASFLAGNADGVEGDAGRSLSQVRVIRDELGRRIEALLAELTPPR